MMKPGFRTPRNPTKAVESVIANQTQLIKGSADVLKDHDRDLARLSEVLTAVCKMRWYLRLAWPFVGYKAYEWELQARRAEKEREKPVVHPAGD
jgi:hypothetical protein